MDLAAGASILECTLPILAADDANVDRQLSSPVSMTFTAGTLPLAAALAAGGTLHVKFWRPSSHAERDVRYTASTAGSQLLHAAKRHQCA